MVKIIISDSHIGTSMWQSAVLEAIKIDNRIETLSDHSHYANKNIVTHNKIFKNIEYLTDNTVKEYFEKTKEYDELEWLICSFPPVRYEALQKTPEKIKILINVGHRLHIHLAADRLIEFTEKFKSLKNNNRFELACMSEYDFHYVKYYTGIELKKLPVISLHADEQLINKIYEPTNKTILIGPSHNTNIIIGFDNDLEKLNKESELYAKKYGFEAYNFQFIKTIYPNGLATLNNLSKHPAVLMNPYSAFSISMVELYQINIPFFIPCNELLVDKMGDVRLFPLYQTMDSIKKLDKFYDKKISNYQYSPNDYSVEAQKYWMKYMYFNQVENAQHWSSTNELFEKLYKKNLGEISLKMKKENMKLMNTEKINWKSIFKEHTKEG